MDEPRVVHVEGGTGVQIGSNNQQTNHYHLATGVRWPVRVGTVPMVADCYQERAVGDGLADTTTTVITGMGGVGKTQIAARHVRASWTDPAVDLAVWVTAVDRDAIVAGYAQAARAIGRATRDDDPAAAAQALVNWLATTDRRWVVVLDDVQDPGHVDGLWPPGRGRTIVTTRRRDAALRRTDRRIVEVDPYTAAESMAYLRSKVARPDLLDGAAELVVEMGGLPLALAQAAAFVQDVEVTCAEYVGSSGRAVTSRRTRCRTSTGTRSTGRGRCRSNGPTSWHRRGWRGRCWSCCRSSTPTGFPRRW